MFVVTRATSLLLTTIFFEKLSFFNLNCSNRIHFLFVFCAHKFFFTRFCYYWLPRSSFLFRRDSRSLEIISLYCECFWRVTYFFFFIFRFVSFYFTLVLATTTNATMAAATVAAAQAMKAAMVVTGRDPFNTQEEQTYNMNEWKKWMIFNTEKNVSYTQTNGDKLVCSVFLFYRRLIFRFLLTFSVL